MITNMVYWQAGKPINTFKRVPLPVLIAKLKKNSLCKITWQFGFLLFDDYVPLGYDGPSLHNQFSMQHYMLDATTPQPHYCEDLKSSICLLNPKSSQNKTDI
jgi:hypothetical protein